MVGFACATECLESGGTTRCTARVEDMGPIMSLEAESNID